MSENKIKLISQDLFFAFLKECVYKIKNMYTSFLFHLTLSKLSHIHGLTNTMN